VVVLLLFEEEPLPLGRAGVVCSSAWNWKNLLPDLLSDLFELDLCLDFQKIWKLGFRRRVSFSFPVLCIDSLASFRSPAKGVWLVVVDHMSFICLASPL